VELHESEGGCTFNTYYGSVAGMRLYAVSVYAERGRVVSDRSLEPQIVRRFVLDNQDILVDPRNTMGTWFNEEDGDTYLDVSTVIQSRREARALGRRYNQIAIFDLLTRNAIETGASGGLPTDIPPVSDRLPPLRQPRSGGTHHQ
jgi:hypothetical protein